MKITKWRFNFAEIKNKKLFNILKTECVKIENKFFKKIDILNKITKKTKWKNIKIKDEVDVITTIENEYKIKSFMNYLTIVIVWKQCVERSFKNKDKNKNKVY